MFIILVKVLNEDEVVEFVNLLRFGLDVVVFSGDDFRVRKVVRRFEVGVVFINEFLWYGIGYYFFGGMKDSGIGREGIGYFIEIFIMIKMIVRNYWGDRKSVV